jgi:hypothetical protein
MKGFGVVERDAIQLLFKQTQTLQRLLMAFMESSDTLTLFVKKLGFLSGPN